MTKENSPAALRCETGPRGGQPGGKRNLGLDALRGVAALGVVATHFLQTYYKIYGGPPLMPVDLGPPAVRLFFIISGFVILMTLDKSKSVWDFALARFARLYPVFWVSAALTFVVVRITGLPKNQITNHDAILNVTMLPAVFGAKPMDIVYWSLEPEIFFYVIAGSIVALRLRKHLIPILCGLMLLGVVDHYLPFYKFPLGYRIENILVLHWWPLFLLGVVFYQMLPGIRPSHLITIALCIVVSFITFSLAEGLVICLLAICVFAATRYRIPVLTNPVLLYVGTISYSFYLFHCNIGYCIIRYLETRGSFGGYSAAGVAFVVTAAAASALCFLIERPSHFYLRDFFSRHSLNSHAPALSQSKTSRSPGI
jgi:peptidoglycan/LPS O-acetylase OafA/YrhL